MHSFSSQYGKLKKGCYNNETGSKKIKQNKKCPNKKNKKVKQAKA